MQSSVVGNIILDSKEMKFLQVGKLRAAFCLSETAFLC